MATMNQVIDKAPSTKAYDFDTPIERYATNSVKWEKYRGRDVIPMWVADMDLPVATPIKMALQHRLGHPIYGYTAPQQELIAVVCAMLEKEFGWKIEPDWLVWLPGTLPGVAAGCHAFTQAGEQIAV